MGAQKMDGFIAALFTAAFLLLLVAAAASAAEGPAVMITDYHVEPDVLMPGDTGTITVTIKNMDTQSSETEKTVEGMPSASETTTTTSTRSISAEIETIRLSSGSRDIEWLREGVQRSEYYNIGALGPGESIPIVIPIKATAYARDGSYFPDVYIEVDNGENVRFPVRVRVDSSEVELMEADIPSEISLSKSEQVELVVANNRPNAVSGVNVHVNSKSEGLEFTPERIFIGDLDAYEKKRVNFTLQMFTERAVKNDVPIASETGIRAFSFVVTYKNGDNVHRGEFDSSVLVRHVADVKLILVNAPESVFKGDVAKIDFDVANGMAKDIKAVSVVPGTEGLRILPSEYFIGDMEVGDVFSASFEAYTRDLAMGTHTISFNLVFRDVDTDRRYEAEGYDVHIAVKEPQKRELPNIFLFVLAPGIIVVVAVLMWVGIKRKRRRREREKL
jgi:hypothetical protein